MHHIKWKERPKKDDSNVTMISGKVNGILMFEITKFKNDMFEDEFILTSKVIPMKMVQKEKLIDAKVEAWGQYRTFLEKIS